MRKRCLNVLILLFCLALTACGNDEQQQPYTMGNVSMAADGQENTEATPMPTITPMQSNTGEISEDVAYAKEEAELAKELEEKGYGKVLETKDNREGVSLGIYYNFYSPSLKRTVENFNLSQDAYWLEIKEYDSYNNVLMDIMRGTGADIFYLKNMPFELFADKGVLEDLTPYFAGSKVICKEQIFTSVWRAGSVNDKYVGVIPGFNLQFYLVEKGVATNGEWTLEDYFALGEKYPDSKLEEHVQEPSYYFVNFLDAALQPFVDWGKMSCNFDSDDFRNLLRKIKENADKEYPESKAGSLAAKLYEKEYLVYKVNLSTSHEPQMSNYTILKDTFLEDFDCVGMPNAEGIPMYELFYQEMYGINANSDHKQAAWAFVEYLFSEEYQKNLDYSMFMARSDFMEEMLDAEINYMFEKDYYTTNRFTGEKIKLNDLTGFTERDKEQFLYIVENAYRNTMGDSEIFYIVREESAPYFAGDKSLDEVVKIIQNRASLYLDEYKN